MSTKTTQTERLKRMLFKHSLVRTSEIEKAGIARPTIARAVAAGDVERVGRGLYRLAGSNIDAAINLVEASKRVPNGVVCMTSALAYHGLTDQIPRIVWLAIKRTGWVPSIDYPPLKVVRFMPSYFVHGVEPHLIAGVAVPIYSVVKSLADVFRNPKLVDRSVAIECLRNAISESKTTPSEIATAAQKYGAWKQMKPYLETITHNG